MKIHIISFYHTISGFAEKIVPEGCGERLEAK